MERDSIESVEVIPVVVNKPAVLPKVASASAIVVDDREEEEEEEEEVIPVVVKTVPKVASVQAIVVEEDEESEEDEEIIIPVTSNHVPYAARKLFSVASVQAIAVIDGEESYEEYESESKEGGYGEAFVEDEFLVEQRERADSIYYPTQSIQTMNASLMNHEEDEKSGAEEEYPYLGEIEYPDDKLDVTLPDIGLPIIRKPVASSPEPEISFSPEDEVAVSSFEPQPAPAISPEPEVVIERPKFVPFKRSVGSDNVPVEPTALNLIGLLANLNGPKTSTTESTSAPTYPYEEEEETEDLSKSMAVSAPESEAGPTALNLIAMIGQKEGKKPKPFVPNYDVENKYASKQWVRVLPDPVEKPAAQPVKVASKTDEEKPSRKTGLHKMFQFLSRKKEDSRVSKTEKLEQNAKEVSEVLAGLTSKAPEKAAKNLLQPVPIKFEAPAAREKMHKPELITPPNPPPEKEVNLNSTADLTDIMPCISPPPLPEGESQQVEGKWDHAEKGQTKETFNLHKLPMYVSGSPKLSAPSKPIRGSDANQSSVKQTAVDQTTSLAPMCVIEERISIGSRYLYEHRYSSDDEEEIPDIEALDLPPPPPVSALTTDRSIPRKNSPCSARTMSPLMCENYLPRKTSPSETSTASVTTRMSQSSLIRNTGFSETAPRLFEGDVKPKPTLGRTTQATVYSHQKNMIVVQDVLVEVQDIIPETIHEIEIYDEEEDTFEIAEDVDEQSSVVSEALRESRRFALDVEPESVVKYRQSLTSLQSMSFRMSEQMPRFPETRSRVSSYRHSMQSPAKIDMTEDEVQVALGLPPRRVVNIDMSTPLVPPQHLLNKKPKGFNKALLKTSRPNLTPILSDQFAASRLQSVASSATSADGRMSKVSSSSSGNSSSLRRNVSRNSSNQQTERSSGPQRKKRPPPKVAPKPKIAPKIDAFGRFKPITEEPIDLKASSSKQNNSRKPRPPQQATVDQNATIKSTPALKSPRTQGPPISRSRVAARVSLFESLQAPVAPPAPDVSLSRSVNNYQAPQFKSKNVKAHHQQLDSTLTAEVLQDVIRNLRKVDQQAPKVSNTSSVDVEESELFKHVLRFQRQTIDGRRRQSSDFDF